MLEFVHLSGSEAGKDLQTRRKVRSQAMRDFRRRQRAEREAGTGCICSDFVDVSINYSIAAKSSGSEAIPTKNPASKSRSRQRVTSKALESPTDSVETAPYQESNGTSKPSLLNRVASTPTSSRQLPTIVIPSNNSALTKSALSDSSREVRLQAPSNCVRRPSQQSSQRGSTASTSPTAWCAEMEDPFQSPAQLNEMSAFCKSCASLCVPISNF